MNLVPNLPADPDSDISTSIINKDNMVKRIKRNARVKGVLETLSKIAQRL